MAKDPLTKESWSNTKLLSIRDRLGHGQPGSCSPFDTSLNEQLFVAATQAICKYALDRENASWELFIDIGALPRVPGPNDHFGGDVTPPQRPVTRMRGIHRSGRMVNHQMIATWYKPWAGDEIIRSTVYGQHAPISTIGIEDSK